MSTDNNSDHSLQQHRPSCKYSRRSTPYCFDSIFHRRIYKKIMVGNWFTVKYSAPLPNLWCYLSWSEMARNFVRWLVSHWVRFFQSGFEGYLRWCDLCSIRSSRILVPVKSWFPRLSHDDLLDILWKVGIREYIITSGSLQRLDLALADMFPAVSTLL